MGGLKGATIAEIRKMTDAEKEVRGWEHHDRDVPVVELDNGMILFPLRDPEGNGPGDLNGHDPNEEHDFGFTFGYMDRFREAAEDQGFEDPLNESPIETPEGWEGGEVEQTGGFILCRIWRTPGAFGDDADEYFEAIYGSDRGVSINRYAKNEHGELMFDGEVERKIVDENTDEAKAEAAKGLMQEFDNE